MDQRWSRIGAIFAPALDVAPDQRDAFVRTQTDDAAIAADVLRLLRLNDDAGDFLETPAIRLTLPAPDYLLSPGDIVADRFAILGPLGRGGMGEVYEAQDRVLGEAVALKVMRVIAGAPADLTERFRQEVQLARRVSHSGVCRVHDVAVHHRANGEQFLLLTMELLRGDTLATRLRQGPLTASDAVDIATQLADALDAAHAQRILHRDLKPENVFLESREGGIRAVLTDFGLAGVLDTRDRDTLAATAVSFGTPSYMAPELLQGQPATVRSDIYAFGRILQDMSIGARPTRWSRAVDKAMAPDSRGRFESAGDVVPAIGGRRHVRLSTRVRLSMAGACVVLALTLTFLRIYTRDRPLLPTSSTVLVVDPINSTGEADLDGTSEVLRSQLAQSPHFQLATTTMTTDLQPVLVVRSTVSTSLGGYVVRMSIERTAREWFRRSRWEREFGAATRDALFEAFRQGSTWVRTMSGETSETVADYDKPPASTTTSSWDALKLFARANSKRSNREYAEAVTLLQQAVQIDPTFARAHMRLADTLIISKRDHEGYDAWRTAIALADSQHLTSRDALLMKGQYYEDLGDLPAAEAAYRAYAVHYGSDFDANFFVGSILADQGKTRQAIPWFETAAALRPASSTPVIHLANAALEVNDVATLDSAVSRLQQLAQTDWVTWLTALRTFALGDVSRAIQRLEPLRTSKDRLWISRCATLQAAWSAEIGDVERAVDLLSEGIRFDQRHNLADREALKWVHLGELARWRKDAAAVADAMTRAIALSADARTLVTAGTVLVKAGLTADARRILIRLENLPDIPRVLAARARIRGELDAHAGRFRAAVSRFEDANATTSIRDSRDYFGHGLALASESEVASRVLGDVVTHPARLYSRPEPELPGSLALALKHYRSAIGASGLGASVQSVLNRFTQLRMPPVN